MTALEPPLVSEKLSYIPMDLAGESDMYRKPARRIRTAPRLWHLVSGLAQQKLRRRKLPSSLSLDSPESTTDWIL
jgi:hypothetical protein